MNYTKLFYRKDDVFLAGSNGLGYYKYHRLSILSIVLFKGVDLKQVSAAEAACSDSPGICAILAIFCVYDRGNLYFVEGQRDFEGNVSFTSSGLPIRTGVAAISPQFNASRNICEVVYASNKVNDLRHFFRYQKTTFWTDNPLRFRGRDVARSVLPMSLQSSLW